MPIPIPLIIAGMVASGAGQAAGSIANRRAQREAAQLSREQMAQDRARTQQNVALEESSLDPFRHQMSQARALGQLSLMEGSRYTPFKMSAAPGYESYVPRMSGGFSYEEPPELKSDIAAIRRNVRGGNVAPSMTDPKNYGRTGALNLLRLAEDGVDPGGISGSSGAPDEATDYLLDVPRRAPGGFGTADSRGTDLPASVAASILATVIQRELGRAPNPGEIDQMLAGQGLKPGDRYVGENGLLAIISALRAQRSPSQQVSYTGRG